MATKESGNTEVASLTFDQLKELLGTKDPGLSPTDLAAAIAEGTRKATKPENAVHPGKSVYSYPEGNEAKPKPVLKCRMFIGGAPIEAQTCTPKEIEALNGMALGHFRVRLADQDEEEVGKKVIEVRGRVGVDQRIERMEILINPEDGDKNNFGSIARLASQCVEANRVQTVAA